MKLRKIKSLAAVALALTIFITYSCGDDSSEPNSSSGNVSDADKSKLYDKIWYPTIASGGTNMEFITEGKIYRINKSLDGTWKWRNNGDTMDVVDHSGARYSFLFEKITNNEMKYRYNYGGDAFGTLYTMKDTE